MGRGGLSCEDRDCLLLNSYTPYSGPIIGFTDIWRTILVEQLARYSSTHTYTWFISLVDGWLRTGDIGYLDGDNYLIITDRKKDIIVNSGGDNIAPARVEGRLTLRSEIAQAMVQGDKRPYLVALIVPDVEFIKAFAQRHGCAADLAALAHDPAFHKELAAVVDRVNADLAQIEKIRRFAIAPQPFSTENQMMTPTLKIRRHVIRAQYGDVLEKLYARSG